MRHIVVAMAALIACFIGFGLSAGRADAGALPGLSAPVVSLTLVEQAGYWRRYCRRNDCSPDVVLPGGDVDVDVDLDVDPGAPAVIVLPPPRPLSCGQYRYWDGERCVDARYNNPYIGPK